MALEKFVAATLPPPLPDLTNLTDLDDDQQLALIRESIHGLDSCMGALVRHIAGPNPKLSAMLDKTWKYNSTSLGALLCKLRFKKSKMAAVQEQINGFLVSVRDREHLLNTRTDEASETRHQVQETLDMLQPVVYNLNTELNLALQRHKELRDTISQFLITDPSEKRNASDRAEQPLLIRQYKDALNGVDEVLGVTLTHICTQQNTQRYAILGLRQQQEALVEMTKRAQAEWRRRNTPKKARDMGCQAEIAAQVEKVPEVERMGPPPPTVLLANEIVLPVVKMMNPGEHALHLPPNLHGLMVKAQPNMPVTLDGWKAIQPIVCRRSILQIYLQKLTQDTTQDTQKKERMDVAQVYYSLMKNKFGLPSMTNAKILELLISASQMMEGGDIRCALFCSLVGHIRQSKAVKGPTVSKRADGDSKDDADALTAKLDALNDKLNGGGEPEEEEEEEEEESEDEDENPDDDQSNTDPLPEWKISPLFRILKNWQKRNVLTAAAIQEETNDGGWITFNRREGRDMLYNEFKKQLPQLQVQQIVRDVQAIEGARVTTVEGMEALENKKRGKVGKGERESAWLSGQEGGSSLKRRNSALLQARREKKFMIDEDSVEIDQFLSVVYRGCHLVWHRLREVVNGIFLAHAEWFVQRQRDGLMIPEPSVSTLKKTAASGGGAEGGGGEDGDGEEAEEIGEEAEEEEDEMSEEERAAEKRDRARELQEKREKGWVRRGTPYCTLEAWITVSRLLLPAKSAEEREGMFVEAIRAENAKKIAELKVQWVRRVCPETEREYFVCGFKDSKDNGGKMQKAESSWSSPFEKYESGVGFELDELAFGDLLLNSGAIQRYSEEALVKNEKRAKETLLKFIVLSKARKLAKLAGAVTVPARRISTAFKVVDMKDLEAEAPQQAKPSQ
jgi:hypothetical protein